MARRQKPKEPHKPRQSTKIPSSGSAKLRPAPEPQRPPNVIDVAWLAEAYHNEIDATIKEGLRRVVAMAQEIQDDGGPFSSYIADMRLKAIEAIKSLPHVNPFIPEEVIKIQQMIGDYIRPLEFLVQTFLPISRLSLDETTTAGQDAAETLTGEENEATDSEMIDG